MTRHAGRYRIAVAAGVLATAAAIIVPSTSALVLPGCKASQLAASMSVIKGSAGAGNIGYKLALKNHGGACNLGNHPVLKLLKGNGAKLPTHVTWSGAAGLVTIGSGHSATARLRFSPDIPGRGEPGKGPCEPTAHYIGVILSALGHGNLAGAVKPPTSVCEHGAIQAQSLT